MKLAKLALDYGRCIEESEKIGWLNKWENLPPEWQKLHNRIIELEHFFNELSKAEAQDGGSMEEPSMC